MRRLASRQPTVAAVEQNKAQIAASEAGLKARAGKCWPEAAGAAFG